MHSVRIWFSKTGREKYISHLDMYRGFLKAVRRARIPLWYTEGFNTHPYITFALPLPIMQESEREAVDIRIEGDMTNEEVKEKLSAVMTPGIKILGVCLPFNDAKEIMYAQYSVEVEFEDEQTAQSFYYSATEILNQEELFAEKTGKKGRKKVIKQVNIIPMIFKKDFEINGNKVCCDFILSAGNEKNLNPTLLMETISKELEIYPVSENIVRKKLLIKDFEEFI